MIGALDWITVPLASPFMQRALIVSVMVGAVCAVLSCYLVLRGWSLMGDAISHAVLPGIVIAYVIGLPLVIGAFAAGLACALMTGYLKDNSRVKEDTVMGVVFTGLFAFGLVIFTKVKSDLHLDHILFGNILGLAPGDRIGLGEAEFGMFKFRSLSDDAGDRQASLDIDNAAALAAEELHGVASVYYSGSDLLEIAAAGVSKASTLERVAGQWSIPAEAVVAFGDMPNDIPMLEWAGHAVAVANAHPSVHAVADTVTASNDEDGVALVLERYV